MIVSSETSILSVALAAEAAGISVVPPKEDGSKNPFVKWKSYQLSRPSPEQIQQWYKEGLTGVGFVCGRISGNLENFEFDDLQIYQDFKAAAEATGLGELVARIEAGYCEMTPGGGVHWPMRCSTISGNIKLACKPGPIAPKTGKPTVETLIETRGEGGYVIVAPSNGKVHPTGKAYRLTSGGIETIPILNPEEREALWQLARTFDLMPKPKKRKKDREISGGEGRPGDDFNCRGDWRELLEKNGWTWVYRRGEVDYWRRPGKDRGISATINHNGSDLLYVFSSSTPFETERGYSKFSAYAILEHNSDFQAAAKALGRAGYGEKTEKGERWKKKRRPPAAGTAEDGRKEIEVREDDLTLLLDEAWDAISTYNAVYPRAFRFGGITSAIEVDEHGDPTIRPLTPEAMRELMAKAARWFKVKMVDGVDEETGEEKKQARRDDVKPPTDLARIMLATPRACLPGLNRIIRAPLVAPSGRIVLAEGYDPEIRTYYVPCGLSVPAVSERPNPEEIHAALILIQAWIVEGRPEGKTSYLGSYEEWAATMGGILEVAGVKGFLENRGKFYDRADRETATWHGFVEAWWEKFVREKVGVKELFGLLDDVDAPCDLGKGGERSQKIRLGDALKSAVDRRFTVEDKDVEGRRCWQSSGGSTISAGRRS